MNIDNFYLVCLVYTEKQAIRIKCLQGLACSPPISVRPPCITEGIIFLLTQHPTTNNSSCKQTKP